MKQCLKYLLLATVLIGTTGVFWGCEQGQDVIRPQLATTITLTPNRLPELDNIYVYELWAAKIDGADSSFTSVTQFDWDSEYFVFRDTAGVIIPNSFELPDTWMNYSHIFISIENRGVVHDQPSGTFMLMAEVEPVDPTNPNFQMSFPVSMFFAIGSWFVATPTDDTLNTSNENKGLWICSRTQTPAYLLDTLAIVLDSVKKKADDPDNGSVDTTGVNGFTQRDTFVVFGYDTIPHHRIDIDWQTTMDNDSDYILYVKYELDSISNSPSEPLGTFNYYKYLSPLENMPDIKPFGWRYNTWVFHEYLDPSFPTLVPFGYEFQEIRTGAPNFKVLPLGGFYRPDSNDLSNKYGDNREVPKFPGEDFIMNLPPGYSSIDFKWNGVDTSGGIWGSVVIGMEPDPSHLTIDSARNFPLFVLHDFLRRSSAPDANEVHSFHNWSQYLPTVNILVEFKE